MRGFLCAHDKSPVTCIRCLPDNLVTGDTNSQQDVFVVSLDVLFDDLFADGSEP